MKRKVIDLEIVEDIDESGVEKISLVDSPAIDVQWFAFEEEKFIEPNPCWSGYEAYGTKIVNGREVPNCVPIKATQLESYNDYPESAVNAAKRALKWRDENPDQDCGTSIGWARANQLANKENISQETISRMASFARHLQWKDVPYTEGCGGLMVDAWGGQAGIEWASSKLEEIQTALRKESFIEPNPCWEGYEAIGTKMLNGREVPNCVPIKAKEQKFVDPRSGESESDFMSRCVPYMLDEGKEQDQAVAICISTFETMGKLGLSYDTSALPPYIEQVPKKKRKASQEASFFQEEVLDIFGYKPKHFDVCPGAVATFTHIMEMVVPKETEGMIRSAALIADRIFEIEKKVMQSDIATEEELREAVLLLDDFKDVMNEVDEDLGMVHDIGYMDGHIITISKYLPEQLRKQMKLTKMVFANEEEQIVVGPALIPGIEIMRKDPDTKEIYYVKFSQSVVRKTAEKFMKELRNRDTNIQHTDKEAGSYVMESWVIDNPEDKANTFYGFDLPVGTWMVAMRVQDAKTWEMVKEGELTGFSIEGNFMDKVDYMKFLQDKERYERVMRILGETK